MTIRILLLAVGCWLSTAAAVPLWVRTYNGPFDYYDEVHAIGVDDSGNVIVSGRSYVTADDEEFVTIKYRPDGDTAWQRRFNPGTGLDGATALAVDRSGNVIITGFLGGRTSEYGDWVTVKYSPGGESLWAAVHDVGDCDRPTSVTVDSAGNSYVTGRAGWQNDLDYVVVKYDPAGNEVWTFRYSSGYNDGAEAVVVDRQGYTYLTGYANLGGGYADIMTWKLGLGGESLWVNVYAGAAGKSDQGRFAALDPAGNLVVAGAIADSASREDVITIKYSATGETLWTRRYAGPGIWGDQPMGIAVDGAGCIYVVGASYTSSGNGYNYVTIKYGPDGTQRWAIRYSGPRNHDWPCGLVLDEDADVYVSGSSTSASNSWDIVTIKYDSAGSEQWLERFDMPSTFDEAYVMALSCQGTVYIGGRTDDDSTGIDYLTLAYGTAGAVAERPTFGTRRTTSTATIGRGVLFLPRDMTELPGDSDRVTRPSLLDAAGRKVMELAPGPNDVSRLAPGVYFIREEPQAAGRKPQAVRRVIVTR